MRKLSTIGLVNLRSNVMLLCGVNSQACKEVSSAVLKLIAEDWNVKNESSSTGRLDFLFAPEFMTRVDIESNYGNDKIKAIRWLRNQPEWIEAGKYTTLGLREAKEYVEYVACGNPMPGWLK